MSWLRKLFKIREQSDGDVVKPFLDHLEDLRWTLIKMAIVLVVGMIIAFCFSKELSALLERPLRAVTAGDAGQAQQLMVTDVVEPFMISLSLSFYAGIVLAFPFLLYFLAEFVLPALTRQERKYLMPSIGAGFVLFAIGVVACFHWIVPKTLQWFHDYAVHHGYDVRWRAREYFALVTHFCLACGLLCELPIAIVALALLGFVSYQFLANTRPYAITIILILVAIIAPTPDPITFLTLAIPVIAIYEACIWIVWLLERRKRNALAA